MARLIDADALDRHWRVPNDVDDEDSYDEGALMMLNRIENAPTVDAVPVVRCHECEHWDRDWKPNHSGENEHYCPMIDLVTDADFFCKNGDRIEGKNDVKAIEILKNLGKIGPYELYEAT